MIPTNYKPYKAKNNSEPGILARMTERRILTMKYIKGGCNDRRLKERLKEMGVIH